MLIKFDTPNGTMTIIAERFFPATKKDLKKLKKAIIDIDDLARFIAAIDSMISQIQTYANDCKARKEIHEMSLIEELEGSFHHKALGRKIAFYHDEYLRANGMITDLKPNKEALHV